jgi:hypothetical protein
MMKFLIIIGIVAFMGTVLWLSFGLPENRDRPEE